MAQKGGMSDEIKTRGGPLCKRGHVKTPGVDCRECNRLRCAKHWQDNRSDYVAKQKAYCDANREAVRARNRAWQRANPERAQAILKAWKNANRERVNELSRQGYARNRDKHAVCVKRWKCANPELWREINNAAKNRRRARIKGSLGSHTRAEWQFILAKQRSKCAICGVAGKLEKDHRIPLALGGSDMAVNLQGLCKPCNGSKSAKIAEGTQFGIFDKISKTV